MTYCNGLFVLLVKLYSLHFLLRYLWPIKLIYEKMYMDSLCISCTDKISDIEMTLESIISRPSTGMIHSYQGMSSYWLILSINHTYQHCCGWWLNTLRVRQIGCHSAEDLLKCIFLNENVWISIKLSRQFVAKGPINNIAALVWTMACHGPGKQWWLDYWCIYA